MFVTPPIPAFVLRCELVCLLSILGLTSGCGRSSPIDAGFGVGTLDVTVGPGGRVIRGSGGTQLEGLVLEIPPGALRRLVRLRIQPVEDFALPDSFPVAVALQVRAEPDPGPLIVPARLQMAFRLTAARDAADLFVANRQFVPGRPGSVPRQRPGLAAESGGYDRGLGLFTAEIGTFGDLQVRIAREPRQIDDANELLGLALAALQRLTDESVVEADQLVAAALAADPYYPAARLLRAVTRVLVVANDRSEQGPGLQSVGEAATAFGLDLRSRSLLRRIVDGVWPRHAEPPTKVPAVGDVLEMLQLRLRPALAAGLSDLAFVPPHDAIVLKLPILRLPGAREVDAADHFFLRALYAFTLYGLDTLEDLDVDIDLGYLLSAANATNDLQALLARFPAVGSRLAAPADRTGDELTEALHALVQAYAALNAETDGQEDDLVVFSSSFDANTRDRWQGNLERLLDSLLGGGPQAVVSGVQPAVVCDLAPLLGDFDPRGWLPAIHLFTPLAGTLPDPRFGGLLPETGQDDATRMFRFANRVTLSQVAITIDGKVEDWPASSEVLVPHDVAGDAGPLPNLDLARVFLARTGDDLVCRLSLASGSFAVEPTQASVYGFTLEPDRTRPRQGGPSLRVTVEVSEDGPRLLVHRDGKAIAVTHAMASDGRELELAVDRNDLFDASEPVRDRVLRAFSAGLDPGKAASGGDTTRRVLFRF